MTPVLQTEHLTRRFRKTEAVVDLSLEVPEGSLFAFVGPNGAGKTTTIKTMMNLLEPSAGRARVLGVDSLRLGPAEFRQIGYVSENQEMYEWMTVDQLVGFCRPLYPTWDLALAATLLRTFDLPADRPIKTMSRGMRMKAALLSSLAYRPKLLVMDEPFAGLDALVREELVGGVLELTGREGWTVFISSHDIDEVERLVDHVGFINEGRLVLASRIGPLMERFRQVDVTRNADAALPTGLQASWLLPQQAGRVARFIDSAWDGDEAERRVRAVFTDAVSVESRPLSLRDIFVALARTWRRTDRPGEERKESGR